MYYKNNAFSSDLGGAKGTVFPALTMVGGERGGRGSGGGFKKMSIIPVFTWQEFVTSSVCNKDVRIEVW